MCPRSPLEKADEHCLAKFPIVIDNVYVARIESTTMNLEARAGIPNSGLRFIVSSR